MSIFNISKLFTNNEDNLKKELNETKLKLKQANDAMVEMQNDIKHLSSAVSNLFDCVKISDTQVSKALKMQLELNDALTKRIDVCSDNISHSLNTTSEIVEFLKKVSKDTATLDNNVKTLYNIIAPSTSSEFH